MTIIRTTGGNQMERTGPTRRAALAVVAASAGLAMIPMGRPAPADTRVAVHTWAGRALGGQASLALCHEDPAVARRAIVACLAEVDRLERIFSLYRADSALSVLNRDGMLTAPPPELVEVMALARRVGTLTEGAFDITVQPLWRLHADHYARPNAAQSGPSADAVAAAARLVDYRGVDVSPQRISFDRPGMAVTLNGIAQGYITDSIVDRLRDLGFANAIVNLGEVRALGRSAAGEPWRIGIPDPTAPDPMAPGPGCVAGNGRTDRPCRRHLGRRRHAVLGPSSPPVRPGNRHQRRWPLGCDCHCGPRSHSRCSVDGAVCRPGGASASVDGGVPLRSGRHRRSWGRAAALEFTHHLSGRDAPKPMTLMILQEHPMKTAAILALAASVLAPSAALAQEGDPGRGERVYRRCAACHSLDEGQNRVGPSLHGLWGRTAGTLEGFRYSDAMVAYGVVWSPETLDVYIESPQEHVRGTTMAFAGLNNPEHRAHLIAYLIQELGDPAE